MHCESDGSHADMDGTTPEVVQHKRDLVRSLGSFSLSVWTTLPNTSTHALSGKRRPDTETPQHLRRRMHFWCGRCCKSGDWYSLCEHRENEFQELPRRMFSGRFFSTACDHRRDVFRESGWLDTEGVTLGRMSPICAVLVPGWN